MTALSASREMLKRTRPATSLTPPSTAEVQAPQVMPSIDTVVVLLPDPRGAPAVADSALEETLSISSASNPQSSMISTARSAERVSGSCSRTARSDSSETLKAATPGRFSKAFWMADVQAPQVIPPTLMVVVCVVGSADRAPAYGGASVLKISASKPLSSIASRTASGVTLVGAWRTTARSMTRLTLTLPTPSVSLKAASTEEVHAPQVIPSTFNVVVAMWTLPLCDRLLGPAASVFVSGNKGSML